MRTVLFLALAAFGAFSTYVMWQVGYLGIWQAGMASLGAWQVLVDLVLMSCIALGYLWQDAQRTGRAWWPFALLTLAAGSLGPLLYLLLQPSGAARHARPATAS
ncbi:MAG: hypothetical protein K9J82_05045 [Methylotenera sp.]|jgi:hypothetical protein|nr:hypothetical protein [Methylotenera sp.]